MSSSLKKILSDANKRPNPSQGGGPGKRQMVKGVKPKPEINVRKDDTDKLKQTETDLRKYELKGALNDFAAQPRGRPAPGGPLFKKWNQKIGPVLACFYVPKKDENGENDEDQFETAVHMKP